MCQYHCEVTPLFTVPPEAFRPAPKVQSTIVRLVPHAAPPVQISDMGRFERLVTQAFSMRRKTLRNCLRGLLDADAIAAAGIDPGLKAGDALPRAICNAGRGGRQESALGPYRTV